MTVTDSAVLILSIFFLLRGASRGFMNSLIGPFSIIAATIISIIYYQATKNIIISLLIGLAGPLLLNLLFKFLLKSWAKVTSPSFLSRIGGAILNLIWGWVFIFLTLILLTVLPPWGETLKAIQHDVTKSRSYLIAKPFENTFFAAPQQNATPVTRRSLRNDAKSLAQDPHFQKILRDPEIQKDIDTHDFAKLMSNPKMMGLVQEIMNDPATMNKVLAIYRSQVQPAKNP